MKIKAMGTKKPLSTKIRPGKAKLKIKTTANPMKQIRSSKTVKK
jgi:hypothetical protein